MKITFCGHSDFAQTDSMEDKMLSILQNQVGDAPAELLLGGYGAFDRFAYHCAKKYKEGHPNVRLIFVTPYIDMVKRECEEYDEIVYPPIESVPYKFAIIKRNEWMIDQAETVIAYVNRGYGGAARSVKYARRKYKRIVNIADKNNLPI